MSAASAAFSSSKRSTRSIRDFNCPAAKPDFAMRCSDLRCWPQSRGKPAWWQCGRAPLAVSLLALGKRRLRVGTCVLLVALFPLGRRHAIDDLARLIFFQRDAFFRCGFAIPVAKAIPAEAGKIHHVDVLHVRACSQMRDQAAKGGGFEFGAGFLIHGYTS